MKLTCTIQEHLETPMQRLAEQILKALMAHDRVQPLADLGSVWRWFGSVLKTPSLVATIDAAHTTVEVRHNRQLIMTIQPEA